MSKQSRSNLLLAGLIMLVSSLRAQTNPNLEAGFKPFGSYDDTNFDSVSITNGNLILHVPLFDYPQRGHLDARLQIIYNGKGWQAFMSCVGGTSCVSHWNPVHIATIQLQMDENEIQTSVQNVKLSNQTIQTYTATTSDGATHQLGARVSGGYESIDGNGIFYNGNAMLKDRSGTGVQSASSTGWQDTNGNFFAGVDTLGRSLAPTTVDDGSGTTGCATGTGFNAVTSTTINAYPGHRHPPPGPPQRHLGLCLNRHTARSGPGAASESNQRNFSGSQPVRRLKESE